MDEVKGLSKETKKMKYVLPVNHNKQNIFSQYYNSIIKTFNSIDINYLVIFLVAFSQGVTGLSDLAMNYLYKDDLKLEPWEVSRINSFAYIPWIIKPVYGFISDSFPIAGYRRKPYLILFGLIVMSCWLCMSKVNSYNQATTLMGVVFLVFLNQISNAFCNVIGGNYH